MPFTNLLSFRSWSLEGLAPPWSGDPLYAWIQANGGNADLPDRREGGENKIGWIAGAVDGVMNHHGFEPDTLGTQQTRDEIVSTVKKLLSRSTSENLSALYSLIRGEKLLSEVGELEQSISEKLMPRSKLRLAALGRFLATMGDEPETVKFGIVLTGMSGNESDRAILELLATHDEFTLYAAQALSRVVSDPEQTLWGVAKRVHGWGRIQTVELLRGTQNREIQAWMLRDGFRNHVMNEYLACICAETGKLHEALKPNHIDAELLDGAADILRALVVGGPAESMDGYYEAQEAIRGYLRHVANSQNLGLKHLLCISRLNGFLTDSDGWTERHAKGWSEQIRAQLRTQCAILMERTEWVARVKLGLSSQNNQTFYEADSAAKELSISTWDVHFARVRASPLQSSSWYRLITQTGEDRLDEVLSFAESALPLDRIASGPSDSLGFGKKYEAHRALGWILQDLRRFPERGWSFIKTGLQSPVTSNRNMALNALMRWPRASWPDEAEWVLAKALREEPRDNLKERLKKALHPDAVFTSESKATAP
jgi:hypothetical protein